MILVEIVAILALESQSGLDYVLIGTIFKEMSLRGSVLDEFRDSNGLSGGVKVSNNFSSPNDQLVLEDESGRVSLSGEISAADLVTGVTIAVRGRVSNDDLGVFQVKGCLFCHPILSPNSELTPPVRDVMSFASEEKEAKYLCLVSGLRIGAECGKDKAPSSIAARLLFSFLAGRLGSANSREVARRVVRTVIAGDSIAEGPSREKIKDNKNKTSSSTASSAAVSEFDLLLAQLLTSCPVDLLPGAADPASVFLPQQPLHPCLFPQSSRFSSFHRVTNPLMCRTGGKLVVGHSGQPVIDICRQVASIEKKDSTTVSQSSQNLEVLRSTLQWGHICPTAPDTLALHPFHSNSNDPFVLDEKPDLFFAGNQPSFATELVRVAGEQGSVRLICLPVFSETGQVVLVDLSHPDLPCRLLQFKS